MTFDLNSEARHPNTALQALAILDEIAEAAQPPQTMAADNGPTPTPLMARLAAQQAAKAVDAMIQAP